MTDTERPDESITPEPNNGGPGPQGAAIKATAASMEGSSAFQGASATGTAASFDGSSTFRGVGAVGTAAGFSPAAFAPAAFDAGFVDEEERADGAGNIIDPPHDELEPSGYPPDLTISEVASASDGFDVDIVPGAALGRLQTDAVGVVVEPIVAPIWQHAAAGADVLRLLDEVEAHLQVVLEVGERTEEVHAGRGHNKPPELLDAPEIDLVAVRTTLAAIPVLRRQLVESEPDLYTLELLLNSLLLGLQVLSKWALWLAEKSVQKVGEYLDNIFGGLTKSFGASIGTPAGVAGWLALAAAIANGTNNDVNALVRIVEMVLKH